MTDPRARLRALRGADLRALHAAGSTPDLAELDGVIDGMVLTGDLARPVVRSLGVWRGKVFSRDASGQVGGLNRLGLGPLEVRRFRFTARIAPSLFGERDVVFLDHDSPANPAYVRRFHDELVQVEEGLWLATSHLRRGGHPGDGHPGDGLRYVCHFALAGSPL